MEELLISQREDAVCILWRLKLTLCFGTNFITLIPKEQTLLSLIILHSEKLKSPLRAYTVWPNCNNMSIERSDLTLLSHCSLRIRRDFILTGVQIILYELCRLCVPRALPISFFIF